MRIAIACGGTGGHVLPGLATARVLKARGHDVQLWLAGKGVEQVSVAAWDGPVSYVRAEGLPGGFSLHSAVAGLRLLLAAFACRRIMCGQRPDVLLAMGSFASFGPVMAARSLRVPVVLHEANAVPGRAVSFLARFAHTVALTFAAVGEALPGVRTMVTGLPVRADSGVRLDAQSVSPGLFTVLVMGGSQGSERVNEVACEAICRLHGSGIPLQVIHLAGAREEKAVRAQYARAGVPGATFGFLEDMARAYAAADLAVSRAGAGSCIELCMFGVPALLVPLPSATRDHQAANARELVNAGAAEMCVQTELSTDWLATYIDRCRLDEGKRTAMRRAMKRFAVDDAAVRLADLVERAAGE